MTRWSKPYDLQLKENVEMKGMAKFNYLVSITLKIATTEEEKINLVAKTRTWETITPTYE